MVGCGDFDGLAMATRTAECRKEPTLTERLSRRLGPSAKKAYLVSPHDLQVSTLVTVAPSVSREAFQQQVAKYKGAVRSWMPEANVASVDIAAGCLTELADLSGVVYVEAGQLYRP